MFLILIMLQENISYFKLICKTATKLGTLPICWSFKNQKLYLKDQSTIKRAKQLLTTHTIFILLLFLQILYFFRHNFSFEDKFIYGIAFVCIFCGHLHAHICQAEASTICLFVNGLLQFPAKFNTKTLPTKPTFLEKLNKLFAYGFFNTVLQLPVAFLYGLHWLLNPCKPSLLGYKLLTECSETDVPIFLQKILKIVIFLGNHWMWSLSLHAALFSIAGIQILCTMSLRSYIQLYDTHNFTLLLFFKRFLKFMHNFQV